MRRNVGTTRARDFYDLYLLYNLYKSEIDYGILSVAIERTSRQRGSREVLAEWKEICEEMQCDETLKSLWDNYSSNNYYARGASYDTVMSIVKEIGNRISLFQPCVE